MGIEGSEIGLGVVGTERAVCFMNLLVKRYGKEGDFGAGGSSRRTVREAVFYKEFYR